MYRWLRRLGSSLRARPTREVLLNDGLELAMDWGENWLAPIQERLLKRHAHLQREEVDELNAICQDAMKFGHGIAYKLVRERGREVAQDEFMPLVLAAYPWVNTENAARLFTQSMYYAWKTGGPAST